MQKHAKKIFLFTGLLFTAAFSSHDVINNEKTNNHSILQSNQYMKKCNTGPFSTEELTGLQKIFNEQYQNTWPAQTDSNPYAYLSQPNEKLLPYAEKLLNYLKTFDDKTNQYLPYFFDDFQAFINSHYISGNLLIFSLVRFQAIRDETKPRNPNHLAAEKSFIESLPNPAEDLYNILTQPALKQDDTYRGLGEVFQEILERVKNPTNPSKGTLGFYIYNHESIVTEEICDKLNRALFSSIPPQIPLPIIGVGYLSTKFIIESMLNNCFPIAFPLSKSNTDLKAHGLHFSDTTFSIHDMLHMLGDPRNKILYRYAEELLKNHMCTSIDSDEAIGMAVSKVEDEYNQFQDILKNFISSKAHENTKNAIAGLFWVLHETPNPLKKIFSIKASTQSLNKRFEDLIESAKKEIDENVVDFDLYQNLQFFEIENQENQVKRETEKPLIEGARKTIPNSAKLATTASSKQIIDLLSKNKKGLMIISEEINEPTENFTYLHDSGQIMNIYVMFVKPNETNAYGQISIHSLNKSIKSPAMLLLESEHNLKILPKDIRETISIPSESASDEEKREFIATVGNGLKTNLDYFKDAFNKFLTEQSV